MTDRFTVRAVVILLGIFALVGLVGCIWLIGRGGTDPALLGVISGLTGTALGALGTLLARTGVDDSPQPVHVTNQPGDPVPVEPT